MSNRRANEVIGQLGLKVNLIDIAESSRVRVVLLTSGFWKWQEGTVVGFWV